MSDTESSSCRLLAQATETDDGLIYKMKVPGPEGTFVERDVNVTKLLQPGPRKTGRVDHLVIEAELHAEGEGGGNPAKPINAETAKEAVERIEAKGLEPAWRAVENPGAFP